MLNTIIKAASFASGAVDVVERLLRQNTDIPPYSLRRLIGAPPLDFAGDEYRAEGSRFRRHLEEAGGLRNGITVGEIGCGCGRMAAPLLDKYEVEYYGFDIVPQLIEWDKAHIVPIHTQARFYDIDVWNSRYNPKGTVKAEDITFPFPEGSCDLIYASSVLTHILTETANRYFSELRRTLAPQGRAVITAFLLDISHPEKMPGSKGTPGVDARLGGTPTFSYSDGGAAHYVYADVPELMVGYNLTELSDMAAKAGLDVSLYCAGSWKHGGASNSFQDIILFKRSEP